MSDERMLTDDEKRASQIKLRTERYIVDRRYSSRTDWITVVTPQEVLFLVAALNHAVDKVAELEMSAYPLLTRDSKGNITLLGTEG
jgi:hypothetical protein